MLPPHSLMPIPLGRVVVEDEFWSPKLDTWRRVTLRDSLDKFERDGALANFDRVASGLSGGHAGYPWFDGLVYEMIRAASDFLAVEPDPELDRRLDGYVERVAAAQAAIGDGYLNTFPQLTNPTHRWGLNGGFLHWQHDVYNAGTLVDAGVHHYLATGKTALLLVAVRFANHMADVMGPPPRKNIVPAHPLPEEALVKLYRLFRDDAEVAGELKGRIPEPVDERRYLALAEFWIESRGNNVGRPDWERESFQQCKEYVRSQAYGEGRPSWGSYAQDHEPVLQMRSIEGHAVRATLLCAGLIAAGQENGRAEYYEAAMRLWESLVYRRMHVTGGVGSFSKGERFGGDYVLPNDGYLETCAAVGAGFFHHNLSLAFGDARFVDELERALYNGVISGVSLEGDSYYYENPLESVQGRARWSWHRCPCCPPMFLKIMSALPGYVYARDGSGLYVNLFVGSRASFEHSGVAVEIVQRTRYPWEGTIELEVRPARPIELTLGVRVPGWAEGVAFSLRGAAVEPDSVERGYALFRRVWREGEVLRVELPLAARLIRANPAVEADVGRVAIVRGPLVYCVEATDNPGPVHLLSVPAEGGLEAEHRHDLLGGVTVVKGTAYLDRGKGDWLYAPADDTSLIAREEVALTAIPYHANSNRGPVEMTTWLRAARSTSVRSEPDAAGGESVSSSEGGTDSSLCSE